MKTETSAPADQRPTFPRWSLKYQDQWLDLLEAYSVALLGREEYSFSDGERIRRAAHLADLAVQETQYRFWIQRQAKRKRPVAKRSGPKVERRRRK